MLLEQLETAKATVGFFCEAWAPFRVNEFGGIRETLEPSDGTTNGFMEVTFDFEGQPEKRTIWLQKIEGKWYWNEQ